MLPNELPNSSVDLLKYDGVDATRLIADSLEYSNITLTLGELVLGKINSVRPGPEDRTIVVKASLTNLDLIKFKYSVDDMPTIVPLIVVDESTNK
ncbi:hypothetical protein EB118_07470 [bacterium]|nr:hypothetical protein [bacterium]NBX98242.1 hypothetical protein [bacterium]NDC94650.1 hypothetical protein [bacterium]NDD84272.1 hypothetical protein [bacterium]NDG29920.1 hypothetical protein [bacterium]